MEVEGHVSAVGRIFIFHVDIVAIHRTVAHQLPLVTEMADIGVIAIRCDGCQSDAKMVQVNRYIVRILVDLARETDLQAIDLQRFVQIKREVGVAILAKIPSVWGAQANGGFHIVYRFLTLVWLYHALVLMVVTDNSKYNITKFDTLVSLNPEYQQLTIVKRCSWQV